jgi:hypothetical protein
MAAIMETEAGGHCKNAQRTDANEKPSRAAIADLREARPAPAPELELSYIHRGKKIHRSTEASLTIQVTSSSKL